MKSHPRQRLRELINALAARPNRGDSFNPYRDPQLARNLKLYLEAMWGSPEFNGVLLVGEALGYRGGGNTGIPFSSCKLYAEAEHPFLRGLAGKLRFPQQGKQPQSEATAAIVWRYLQSRQQLPLFWNAFPFHPHISGVPDSNRKPRAAELAEGVERLQELYAIFKPRRIAGIGRAGHQAAASVFPGARVSYIRHPSYGGKADFVKGMDALLE